MSVVEVGQYFVTRTLVILDNFVQWLVVSEYTLPRDGPASQPKGWIQGKMRIGPCIGSHDQFFQTSNMELKFELSPCVKTILILGSEFLTEPSNM